jgi:hypothetical protein
MVGRTAADIERALLRKGFVLESSHHRVLHHVRGKDLSGVRTFLSHGSKDYGPALLARVSRQLHLSKAELLQLIDCGMSSGEYVALLVEREVLDP